MSRGRAEGPGRIQGPGRRGPRLAAAGIGLAAALFLVELNLRLEGPTVCRHAQPTVLRAASDVGWTFEPHLTFTTDGCDGRAWSAPVSINSQGLADQEWPLEKRPGEVRVLLLGDQLADGLGVARSDRLSVRLSHLADQRRGSRLTVINAQIPGYDTERQLLFLEKRGLAHHPDVVVAVLDPVGGLRVGATIPLERTLPPASGLLPQSAVARWLTGLASEKSSPSVASAQRAAPLSPAQRAVAWRSVLSDLNRLAEQSRAAGAGFAVLIAPPCPFENYPPDLCSEIETIAPCADLRGSFATTRATSSHSPELCIDGLGRWGRDGHFLASHALWDLIARNGLWPKGVVRGYRL